jgi:hypothetical protein
VEELITEMHLGPVRFKVEAKAQAAARPFEHQLVVRETAFRASTSEPDQGIQSLYQSHVPFLYVSRSLNHKRQNFRKPRVANERPLQDTRR